jgi:hypothetical protein
LGYLQIAEARVIYNGYNVALGKAATAPNVYANMAAFVPRMAVDGKSNTLYISGTVDNTSSLLIDLQVGMRATAACAAAPALALPCYGARCACAAGLCHCLCLQVVWWRRAHVALPDSLSICHACCVPGWGLACSVCLLLLLLLVLVLLLLLLLVVAGLLCTLSSPTACASA